MAELGAHVNIDMTFVTGGKAIFTVENNNHRHYTYQVKKARATPQNTFVEPPHFVFVLTNTNQYVYVGMLVEDKVIPTYKSKHKATSDVVKVFNFGIRMIKAKNGPKGYSVLHEGCCGKCGRPLTDPESIRIGFGPTCRNSVGL